MQPSYRPPYSQQQQPQRSPHAPVTASRRGIGPMVGHPQNSMTQAQLQAQQAAAESANTRAKMRSRKPTDKTIPEGVEECIIGDGVQRYKELRELERKLDATMMRKRLDIHDAVNRNVKRYKTLRLWISNTVEDQPWQADGLEPDAFDFSTNLDSSYRVKIEGRLLDDLVDDNDDSDSDDEPADADGDAMDEGGKEEKTKTQGKQYKFSHFFKAMTVDYDKTKAKELDQPAEWKKPSIAPNTASLPIAADFDQLEFKRGGDDNINITINLFRDETPERFLLSPALANILDTNEATRAEAVMGVWNYIKAMGLQEDDDKRTFELDDRMKIIFGPRDKGYIPQIPEIIINHLSPLPPIKLIYTIRVDKAFHDNPQPTIYDVRVAVDDPLSAALTSYITNPSYAQSLREVADLNDNLAKIVQKIANSKSKHIFFDALSKNPTEFFAKWLSSQKRDLEVISGEATRGGGEDASGEEWRKGGKDGVWGSENARQSVNLIVGSSVKK